MELRFSASPGCWERHLQRQYNNPLFSHLTHPVTQQEIAAAQQKDEEERQTFGQTFEALLKDVANLEAQVEIEVILKLKTRIESLYEQCAGLGGDFQVEKQGLRKLNDLVMQSILNSSQLEPEIQSALEKESPERQLHFTLLEHSFIAHLLHPKSPITQEDIVATLLTEEEAPLRAAMSLFNAEQRQILCQEARNLLNQLQSEGHHLPTAWEHLAIMEQSFSNEFFH